MLSRQISTHTALTGCDDHFTGHLRIVLPISTHTALTGCDFVLASVALSLFISTHTALTGCDNSLSDMMSGLGISTHTALTGCDSNYIQIPTPILHIIYIIYTIPRPKVNLLPLSHLTSLHIPGANPPGFSCALMIRTKISPYPQTLLPELHSR